MAVLILPGRLKQQPQRSLQIADRYRDAALLALCNDGTGRNLARDNHLVGGGLGAAVPILRPHGYSLNFSPEDLITQRSIEIPSSAPGLTIFAWVRPEILNTSYRRIAETSYVDGFYLGSNSGSQYLFTLNGASLSLCVGGQQVVGRRDFVCGTFDGSTRILYVNGVQVASASATRPSWTRKMSVGSNASGGEGWTGDIDTVGLFLRPFPASEIWSLYQDPWRLLKAPASRVIIGATAPSDTNNLTGAASSQANAAGTGAIVQEQALIGAASAQGNTASEAAVTQGVALTAAASAQGNDSPAPAITQDHALALAPSVQDNAAAASAIVQAHVLAAANASQANASGNGAVTQANVLVFAPSIQDNVAAASAIVQEQMLVAAEATQGNVSAAGAITRPLEGAASLQPNTSATARIDRPQTLTAAASVQPNLSRTGIVSDGIVTEASLTTGITEKQRIKKPGIPAGTPEWLKTMLEIIIGRRGNAVEVPKFQTLTFSATPTKAECEALYSYVNTIRAAVDKDITRLDS